MKFFDWCELVDKTNGTEVELFLLFK